MRADHRHRNGARGPAAQQGVRLGSDGRRDPGSTPGRATSASPQQQTKEVPMSYDIHLEIDTGGGKMAEVWWVNYTSNVSPMWRKALTGTAFESLGAMDGHLASECAPALRLAIKAMLD